MKKTPQLPGSAMQRASGLFSHPVGQRFNLKPLFCHMTMLGSALLSAPVLADCVKDAQGNYACSGTLQQTRKIEEKTSATLYVTTSGRFSIEAPSGDALYIENSLGPVSYTDKFASPLTSLDTTTGFGLRILTTGHSINIDSNGAISGIKVDNTNNAGNYGNIIINVTADINNRTTGSQAANDGMGISAIYSSSDASHQVNIQTNHVSAVNDGINILNEGLGLNVIHAKGNVSSDNKTGVYVRTTNENAKSGITITTDGTVKGGTSGITVDYAGLGNINITSNGTVHGEAFGGIHVDTAANSTANITVTTADVSGGGAGIRIDNQGVGNVTITSNGNITTKESTTDKTKAGIAVTSSNGSAGEIAINANGTIQSNETGIFVDQSGTGKINIIAKQAITADLGDGVSVRNTTASSDIIVNTAAVTGANHGIYVANDGLGATSITATDTVTALSGVGIYAENAHSSSKDITLSTADVISPQTGILALQSGTGAINITTGSVEGTEEAGVEAEINNLLSTADITITTQGKVTGGFSGISAKHAGAGKINITANHIVEGGDGAIEVASNGQPINITINGTVRNLTQLPTDLAVNTVGGPATLTNNNQLIGTVQFENSASKIINNGTWNTAGEAVQWFSNINGLTNTYQATLVNTGTINTQAGVTRFSGFATFTNAGTINISDKSAGDRVEIDGHYIGQGGTVILDTVLGDDQTTTDTLHLQNGSTGHTKLIVLKQGNGHATLTHEGIQLIEVTNGPSDAVFTLNNRVVAGPYEYELYQGSISNPQDGHWYLRSQDDDISDLTPGSTPKQKYRAEVGAYLGNQMAAQNMFMHSLSARIGEAQNAAAYSSDTHSTGWARITVNHSKNEAVKGKLQEKTNMDVLQLGQDIARWSRDGKDQWRIGVMGGAGHSKTSANVRNKSAKAYGKVNGYSAGIYGTWFTHAEQNQGLYVDTWLQQGWYRNGINGHDLPQENYRSRSLTTSIELGYGIIVGQSASRHWVVEPQGQLTHINYRSHEVTEKNGTRISKMSEHNVLKRLGMRVSSRPADKVGGLQPFVEVNWLHGHHANTLSFGGNQVANDVPESRFQLKAGVQGTLSKNWQLWGHVSGEKGKNNYKGYEGSAGLKYNW